LVTPRCPLVTKGVDRASFRPLPGLPAEVRDLWPAIEINAPAQGKFGGADNVELNNIFELSGAEPEFLNKFRTELKKPRWIDPDTVCFFKITGH
jgi:hypothetical protein